MDRIYKFIEIFLKDKQDLREEFQMDFLKLFYSELNKTILKYFLKEKGVFVDY